MELPDLTLRVSNFSLRAAASSFRAALAFLAAFAIGSSSMALAAPVFPLKASADGRYLVDQNNVPFRIQGDSPWNLLVGVTSTEADTYLANRQAKGFNTLLIQVLERRSRAGSPAPANKNGDLPFLTKLGGGTYTGATDIADLTTPNDAYFSNVDAVLAKLASRNMVTLLAPLYVGYGADTTPNVNNEGWAPEMNVNGNANCYKYGQYVGDRYRNQSNIIWVAGGDWTLQPPTPATVRTCMQQVMQGIKDGKGRGGSNALQTAHWVRGQNSTDDPGFSVQLNSVYALPTDIASRCRSAYARAPVLPAYVIEGWYEGEHGMTPEGLRQEAYRTVLSCIGGYVFGNLPIWDFEPGWQTAMNAVGSLDFQRAGALFDALPWQTLVPSNLGTLSGKVLIPGSDISQGGDVAAAASAVALVAYVPSTGTSTRSLNVDMSALAAMVRARWFNPTSGTYTNISGGAYNLPNLGIRTFTTPGNNGTGTNDWVLVLDTLGVAPPAPTNLRVVEYYNSGFDHYFMTADSGEVASLDDGAFGGAWVRTGASFDGYADAINNAVPVCRFFSSSFAPKSSHFYTADASECAVVMRNPDWQFESIAFDIPVPDASGNCPAGTSPVYRLYNNGQGGAPNHRFTTSAVTKQDFVANRGYVSEGVGQLGVVMCSPA